MEQNGTPRRSSFKRAERTQVKFKIGISGPSGSGKTKGALALAAHLAGPDGRVAVIDTENSSAAFYSDDYEFDHANLAPPFTTRRYLELMEEAALAGFDVIVVDSITHEWAGTGGILEQKDEADRRPGSNSYTNWNEFTKQHNKFIAAILEMPIHMIVTMRSKQDYVLEDKNGKKVPQKLGMAPIQREGMEYELGVVFDVQMDHRAKVSKKRIDALDTEVVYDLTSPKVARILLDWLKSGKPLLSSPLNTQSGGSIEDEAPEPVAPLSFDDAQLVPLPGPEGSWGGKAGNPLGTFTSAQLTKIREYLRDSLEKNDTVEKRRAAEACTMILDVRDREAAVKAEPDPAVAMRAAVAAEEAKKGEPEPKKSARITAEEVEGTTPLAPAATLDDHGESEHAYTKGVPAEEAVEAEPSGKKRGRSADHPKDDLPF